jgi:hypothetical protein
MSNSQAPNPSDVQTEDAAFQSQAANIEAKIRNEIDSRPIMVTN